MGYNVCVRCEKMLDTKIKGTRRQGDAREGDARRIGSAFRFCALFVLSLLCISRAHASVALLLEEPFGHFGALTATGHAAVYLPSICASSPVVLRRCNQGELGVVLSRYNAISGYDWIAVPLIPYLYAVQEPGDVPLFANEKLIAFLRNQYRRKFLETLAPDSENGEPPTGNWIQLVGAAYDRTIYSYKIETTEQQDDALIKALNSRPNRSRFHLLSRNCADFARAIINFYYPHTLHRSLVADLGITTPKQLARTLVRFDKRHPDLESASFVIPQVPGNVPRSTPVYGVLESFLKSKKYFVPLAAFHPIITGGMALAYLSTGRFDPAKQALVLDSSNSLRPAMAKTKRQTYEDHLNSLMARWNAGSSTIGENIPLLSERLRDKKWKRLEAEAEPSIDSSGRPVLKMEVGEQLVDVGLSRDNILTSPAPPVLAQEILASRLRDELRRSAAPKTAETDVVNDWNLLRQVTSSDGAN